MHLHVHVHVLMLWLYVCMVCSNGLYPAAEAPTLGLAVRVTARRGVRRRPDVGEAQRTLIHQRGDGAQHSAAKVCNEEIVAPDVAVHGAAYRPDRDVVEQQVCAAPLVSERGGGEERGGRGGVRMNDK